MKRKGNAMSNIFRHPSSSALRSQAFHEGKKGLEYIFEKPETHIAHQSNQSIQALNQVPNMHPAGYFIDKMIRDAITRSSRRPA
jgi:hypothetical protein